jgi:putative aminopeptidase FrvX
MNGEKSGELVAIARRLMQQAAAPYHEQAVRAEVEAICNEAKLKFRTDKYGNILVHLRTAPGLRPLVLAAHMDHPGFEIIRKVSDRKWLARFLGGVPDAYFVPGTSVRLMPGEIKGKLGARQRNEKTFYIESHPPGKHKPKFAVWELSDFSELKGQIHGRACDDLVGVACILSTLRQLKRERAQVNVIGAITRAEEVGFQGALTLAASKLIPGNSMIVSLETSRELPGAVMGQGVILRVGDKTSIFDSAGSRYLAEIGEQLKLRDKTFRFQRALMSGGTCEATAYQEFGYQCAAVCVALGNYHNCAANNRIKAEYVNIGDALGMVQLLTESARQVALYSKLVGKLPSRLAKLQRTAKKRLLRTIN